MSFLYSLSPCVQLSIMHKRGPSRGGDACARQMQATAIQPHTARHTETSLADLILIIHRSIQEHPAVSDVASMHTCIAFAPNLTTPKMGPLCVQSSTIVRPRHSTTA